MRDLAFDSCSSSTSVWRLFGQISDLPGRSDLAGTGSAVEIADGERPGPGERRADAETRRLRASRETHRYSIVVVLGIRPPEPLT